MNFTADRKVNNELNQIFSSTTAKETTSGNKIESSVLVQQDKQNPRNLDLQKKLSHRIEEEISIALRCEYTYENVTIDLCATTSSTYNSPKLLQGRACIGDVVFKYNIWNHGKEPIIVKNLFNEDTAVSLHHLQNVESLQINGTRHLELEYSKSMNVCETRGEFLTKVAYMRLGSLKNESNRTRFLSRRSLLNS